MIRLNAAEVEFAWKLESTKCPVIDAWIAEKRKDVLRAEMDVTALDFDLYYSH